MIKNERIELIACIDTKVALSVQEFGLALTESDFIKVLHSLWKMLLRLCMGCSFLSAEP